MLKRFLKDKRGATAVEYGIIIAVISLVITGSLGLTLNAIENNFYFAKNKIDAAYED